MQNVDTSSQPGRAQVDFLVEQADELIIVSYVSNSQQMLQQRTH